MRKASFVGAAAIAASLLLATPAVALGPETFNGFTPENPLTNSNSGIGITDNDWRYSQPADQGDPDIAIVANGIDGNSLRISNAYTDGNFGNWLYSPRLPGGGVQEDGDGNKFTAEYEVKSTSLGYQPGLQVSVSPQSRDGARMSFLRFQDSDADVNGPGGIDVYFADYQDDAGLVGRTIQIANDQPRQGFTVRIELDLYTGAHNDVAQVFIDDGPGLIPMTGGGFQGFFAPVDHPDTFNKLKAGQSVPMKWKLGALEPATTWEDYYKFNPESNADPVQDPDTPGTELLPKVNGEWEARVVDSLIFQARSGGGTALNTLGGGFLFDNVELTSSGLGTLPRGGAVGDASVYGSPIFTAYKINCLSDANTDTLEEVATPGASHLTYDAATGIWHYNWQTRNVQAGTCVKLVLNVNGEFALFKLIK